MNGKKTLIIFFSLAGILAAAFFIFAAHASESFFPGQKTCEVTYRALIRGIPEEARSVRVWIPLASSRDGQTVLKREMDTPAAYQVTADPVYGNEMVYFDLKPPFPKPLEFQIRYEARISRKDFRKAGRKREDIHKYLKPSMLMTVNEEVLRRTQAAVGQKEGLLQKARAIYEDVIRRMTYDKTLPGWGQGDTLRACLLGKGNCTDFHSLFISMAHAAEIPARFKIGLTIPDAPEGEIPGYHCWAEFYDEARGWLPVDASEAWKHPERKEIYFGGFDAQKFLISMGRDVELVPRQSGPPVNIFFYPYVEVDGKEWNDAGTSFRFRNLK
ncbi:MAG: transglutaminase domain-containing protein [Candidatus Omnitrophica bacterium]|nr:transglutaminase domain-containing protein [Candidatus Omnitrophota bacterium]